MVLARVWYGVLESGHALLVGETLVAEETGRHDAAGEDSRGDQVEARVGSCAGEEAGHVGGLVLRILYLQLASKDRSQIRENRGDSYRGSPCSSKRRSYFSNDTSLFYTVYLYMQRV